MLPITIVSATRFDKDRFYVESALGRTLAQTYPSYPTKAKIYFNNTLPLPICFNDAIAAAADPEEVMVFVHDDVFIVDFFWIDKLLFGFQNFDVLGLAGNTRRLPRQPSWAFVDDKLTWDTPENLSGVVGHGQQFPCQLSIYGQLGKLCKLLDGVLLAVKKSTLDAGNICFDERFDFHFYDLDFCRQVEMKNLRMGTIPLGIVHQSGGNFGSPQWRMGYERYLKKWNE
jgi:GT2 family glycosyltransferase